MVGIFGIEGPLNSHMGNDDCILDRYLRKQARDWRTLEIDTSLCLGGKFLTWNEVREHWDSGGKGLEIRLGTVSEITRTRKR